MNLPRLSAVAAFASLGLVACTSSPSNDEGVGWESAAISGTLVDAKACAVKAAYEAAPLTSFTHITKDELPEGLRNVLGDIKGALAISRLDVSGVGAVYVINRENASTYWDARGDLLANRRVVPASPSPIWGSPTTSSLQCDASTPTSCLSTTPVDVTGSSYRKSAPRAFNACSESMIERLTSYYRANAAAPDFSIAKWKAEVGPSCQRCVFTAESDPAWSPIVAVDDHSFVLNRGGCIEQHTSFECGRAYQQHEECAEQACGSCTSADELRRCLDGARDGAACKPSRDAVAAACQPAKLFVAEQACTPATFDGAIRALCTTR